MSLVLNVTNVLVLNATNEPSSDCLRVSFFQQKVDHFQILPTSIKIYYLKLSLSFDFFLYFPICT